MLWDDVRDTKMDQSRQHSKDAEVLDMRSATKQERILQDDLPTTKLIYDPPSDLNPMNAPVDSSVTTITLPSILVDDIDVDHRLNVSEVNDDEPPPYTAIVPPNHVGWPFDFSSDIPYSARTPSTACRPEMPLASFQTPLMQPPPPPFHVEGEASQHAPITVPLMPYGIFKFGSHRSLLLQRASPFPDNRSIMKGVDGKTRRYGAILVATAVIVFLMVLSLLVRFIVEKSFWRR